MYAKHATGLVSIYLESDSSFASKSEIEEIVKNPKKIRKIFVFDANKTAMVSRK